jgi:hypothetical protein
MYVEPCEECITRVILMVCIYHHIPDAKKWKPDTGAVSVMHHVTHHKNKRHGIIAAAREVRSATHHVGQRFRLILRQRILGSVRAVRAVRNTRVFLMETSFVADVRSLFLGTV